MSVIPYSDIKLNGIDGTNHIAMTINFMNFEKLLRLRFAKLMKPSQIIVGKNQNTIAVALAAPSSPVPLFTASKAIARTTAIIGVKNHILYLFIHNVRQIFVPLHNAVNNRSSREALRPC